MAQDTTATQQPATQPPDAPEGARPLVTLEDGYPSLRFGSVRLDLHGRVQTDMRRSDAATHVASDVDFSRKRVGIEGEIGRRLSFELDAEVGDDNPWRDALVDYRVDNALRVRVGQFKVPFSLEATTSAANLDFAYRSQAAAQLTPGRERGVMFHGRFWRRALMYEAAAFLQPDRVERDERASVGRTAAVRLASAPFSRSTSSLSELEVGVAGAISTLTEGVSRLNGRTALGEPLFDSVYWVRGMRRRIGAEARWEPGPFSLATEYMHVSDERRGQGLADVDLPALEARGWYVSGTWLLTGEAKASGARPGRSVLNGGIGAIEAAVRLERLRFGNPDAVAAGLPNPRAVDIPGSRNQVLTAGLNWYLHRSIKVQANLIREVVEGAVAPTGPATLFSQVFRLQFRL